METTKIVKMKKGLLSKGLEMKAHTPMIKKKSVGKYFFSYTRADSYRFELPPSIENCQK